MKRIVYILFPVLLYMLGCEAPQDMNRPGDKLDGYIFFADSSLNFNGGYYSVSVFSADSTDPFHKVPYRTDSLQNIYLHGYNYQSQFSMDGIPAGRFYIASTWSRYPKVANEIPIVLGTYGCDTSFSCTAYKIVVYPNTQGNFRNITSWADIAKRLN